MNGMDHDPASEATAGDDAALAAWLVAARLDPVPDEGFSAAVMERLPDPGRYRRRSKAPLWGAGLGGGLLAAQLAGSVLLPQSTGLGGAGPDMPGIGLVLVCVLGLSALMAGWIWAQREG